MSCSGEGHSQQFISVRLGKNVNMTHTLSDVQKHSMVTCLLTEGFRKDSGCKRLQFLIQDFRGVVALCILLTLIRTVERKLKIYFELQTIINN